MADTDNWSARFRLLGQVFAERMAAGRDPDPAVAWAWRQLRNTAGQAGIDQLAQEIGISRRHLSRWFRAQVGLTPKKLARMLRFLLQGHQCTADPA